MEQPAHSSTAPLEKPFEPLRWIGTYKIAKGMLALVGALLLLRLMNRNLPDLAIHWMGLLHIEPQSAFGRLVLHRIIKIHHRNIAWLAVGLFGYVPLACAEGIGLMLRKVWAEWLTVVTTFAMIPVEIREVVLRPTWIRVVIMALNVLVLIYLIVRIHRDRHRHAPWSTSGAGETVIAPPPREAGSAQNTVPRQSARQ